MGAWIKAGLLAGGVAACAMILDGALILIHIATKLGGL